MRSQVRVMSRSHVISWTLNCLYLYIDKQCRPRSDVVECGIWSGSSLFVKRNFYQKNIWVTTRQNMSSGVSDQARHKPACAATEASKSLEISAIESRDIILSKQWKTKAQIKLHGCAVWYAPLLFAYDIRHVFSWPGSYIYTHTHTGQSRYNAPGGVHRSQPRYGRCTL